MFEMGQIDDFVPKIGPKSCFFRDTNLVLPTLGGLGPQNFKVSSFLLIPIKNVGNIGQNEPWAGAVASKLSERRPPTFFHRRDAQKHEKWYFFVFPTFTGHSDLVDPTWGAPCES